ncbi:MAG: hypothetical protein EBZ48_16990 [Proteobacteria bacterium]|nr:hypothetical protein [Pseudomonadota bacterium]
MGITAAATVSAAAIGGLFTYLASREKNCVQSLKSEHKKAADQVISYFELEQLYVNEVSRLTGTDPAIVQKDFLDKVETSGHTRPSWSSITAKRSIERFDW